MSMRVTTIRTMATTTTTVRHGARAALLLCVAVAGGVTDAAAPLRQTEPGLVDRNVAVPMRDGVVLRADVFRPASAGPSPTLVYRTPYDKADTAEEPIVRAAVGRGYAVVLQDVRGRYASDGVFRAYEQEGKSR